MLVLVEARLELAEPSRSRALLALSRCRTRAPRSRLATARGDVLQAAASRVGLAYAASRGAARAVQDVEAAVAKVGFADPARPGFSCCTAADAFSAGLV